MHVFLKLVSKLLRSKQKPNCGTHSHTGQMFFVKAFFIFFRFNGFFDEDSTQETLYHNSVCPLIPYVLQGHNASVFAYGPTGAGMSEIEDITKNKTEKLFC